MTHSTLPSPRARVTVVTPAYPTVGEPFRGIYNFHRANALHEWADVKVVCALARYPSALEPRSAHRGSARGLRPLGLPARLVEYPALPLLSRALNAWVCARRMRAAVRETAPDLLLAYWVYPEGHATVRVARELGVPAIVGAIGSDLRAIADRVTRRGVRATLGAADHVVTVSDELRRRALELGAASDRVTAILNGCDGEVFRPSDRGAARASLGVPDADRVVLFVGRLAQIKGVRELLEAAARAAAGCPGFRLVLIGEGPLEPELRARAAGRDLAGRVQFAGRCEAPDVARWLAASDVLCLPSHSEGCPNVVIEALRCGRPVVASDVGGIPELVDETSGVLTPAGDVPALAAALAAALGRAWDTEAIASRHGRTWRDVGRETWAVCARALAARPRSSETAPAAAGGRA